MRDPADASVEAAHRTPRGKRTIYSGNLNHSLKHRINQISLRIFKAYLKSSGIHCTTTFYKSTQKIID